MAARARQREKPTLFIGSSSEGLRFAEALGRGLNEVADVMMWNQGVFKLSDTLMEALVTEASAFDFAVLVFTPDDSVTSRTRKRFAPRDNVILELGLFIGCIGRKRTIVVRPDGENLQIPSDLSGLVTAKYEVDKDARRAVSSAAFDIKEHIARHGKKAEGISEVVKVQQDMAQDLQLMRIITDLVISKYEREHLTGLDGTGSFLVDIYINGGSFRFELQHLLNADLIKPIKNRTLDDLFAVDWDTVKKSKRDPPEKDLSVQKDLKEYLAITDPGRKYLRAYRELTRFN